jgi:hypothetical protein
VVGLAWSGDPDSHTGGIVAIGKVSHAGQVKGEDPDNKAYSGPPGWGLDVRPTTSSRKKGDVEKTSDMPRRGLIIRRRTG